MKNADRKEFGQMGDLFKKNMSLLKDQIRFYSLSGSQALYFPTTFFTSI